MAKRRVESSPEPPDHCFSKELAGEAPPSFSNLQTLYGLASELLELRPWELLNDSDLILVRAGAGGQMCYCSVMGALGEVYSMHAYIGAESFRLFRAILAEEITDPFEFLARQHSVSVEFVPRSELERQDRELLGWLGHPKGKGIGSPIFRAIRPGYFPWFVSAEEAETLGECIRAVLVVCSAILGEKPVKFWGRADTYPLVTKMEGDELRYKIELIKPDLPNRPDSPPVQLDEELLASLRKQDYPLRGVLELDHIVSGARVGKAHERKTGACLALAVDGVSGLVYAPETTDLSMPAADALANVFLKSVQQTRCMPREVRVRTGALKACLSPLLESLGVTATVSPKLREADKARAHLLQFLGGGV